MLAQRRFPDDQTADGPGGLRRSPLLGLNGTVIKAHGSARERAIMNAIRGGHGNHPAPDQRDHFREITQANERLPTDRCSRPGCCGSMSTTRMFKNPRAKHGFKGRTCSIISVGSYVPERILTNAELEKMVDTTDEWITSRTGIKERRIAAENEFTSDMAAKAALRAMEKAGITRSRSI